VTTHAALSSVTINLDPVLHLGPLQVHWYGIMYAVAFLVAFRYGVLPHVVRKGKSRALAEKIALWTIVFGLVGGRLYYVLQQTGPMGLFNYYIPHPEHILAIWEGGMAFYGAIIAGFITLAITGWRYGLSPWLALDGGVLFAVVGQPIGRIGNIINGDILGAQSNLPWATAYTFHTSADHCSVLQQNFFCGVSYQPAAAYEALATILIGVLLFQLRKRDVRDGVLAMVYVACYAVSQLLLFQVRTSEPAGLLGLRQAQWTSIGMLVIGLPLLYVLWRRSIGFFEARDAKLSAAAVAAPPTRAAIP
jgi:phosphatidylglycerol:prolipoprotein diacylglycerol transferase